MDSCQQLNDRLDELLAADDVLLRDVVVQRAPRRRAGLPPQVVLHRDHLGPGVGDIRLARQVPRGGDIVAAHQATHVLAGLVVHETGDIHGVAEHRDVVAEGGGGRTRVVPQPVEHRFFVLSEKNACGPGR